MKKRNVIKGSLSHHPLLPTGILMTVWRHPESFEPDTDGFPAELEDYLHDMQTELESKSKQIARLSSRLRRLESKTKKPSRRRKIV